MPPAPSLVWDDSLKVGNEIIDHDHQETVELLAELIAADRKSTRLNSSH